MSEQKYYVKLNREICVKDGEDYYGYDTFSYSYTWLDIDYELYPSDFRHPFTKSELSKIMDGALYRGHETNMDCVFLGCEEWINPLIELVPVEEK